MSPLAWFMSESRTAQIVRLVAIRSVQFVACLLYTSPSPRD
jgi:hypothetical protein